MDVVDTIKDKLPLAEHIERHGIKLNRQGHTLHGLCPFHQEKSGSFVVWPEQDSFYCFGCGVSGDIFDFYQRQQSCDFGEALKELARLAGVELRHKPEELETLAKSRERAAILAEAVEHYRKQLGLEHREYLKRRGFSDEFISAARFGWAPGGTLRKALIHVDATTLGEIGLVNKDGRDFFWKRLIIPVLGRGGEVANLAGRAWDKDLEPKYLRLPGPAQLINEVGLRKADVVYLAEGEIDTLTLAQLGLPAVGVGGAKNLKNGYAEKFKRLKAIYVCADSDDAGRELTRRAGELLGNRCRVVQLPTGEDLNSWVGQKGNDLEAMAAVARPFLDYLIEALPTEIESDKIDETIKPVLQAVSNIGKGGQESYLKRLSKATGVGVVALRECLRELTAEQATEGDRQHDSGEGTIVWKDVRSINPAQDFVDGVMYTTAFLDVLVTDPETELRKLETLPYVVTSRREVFPLNDVEAYRRGLRVIPTKIPVKGMFDRRWSIDESLPYSVKSYLDAGATVSPWEVYTEVVGYFRKYVDYPNELYYDYLALWTIGTYWYNLFSAYPYSHLTGTKRVGKSLTLQIVGELAFNALFSSSMTAAAAFRSVEACSTTLLLDEAENLEKKDKDEKPDEKIEILKSGYMKGPKAIRCTGDNHDPVGFDVYSPKMFGSINEMDKILADRAITLTLARSRKQLTEFNFQEVKPLMAATRDKLYVLMLDHAKDVMENINTGINWDKIRDRERQLWTPILTLAGFFDQYQVDEAEGEVQPENLLISKMRNLALQKGEEKLAKEQAEQVELLILESLIDYLKTTTAAAGHYYPSAEVLAHLHKSEELSWIRSGKYVIQELERLTVIQNKKVDTSRVRINGKLTRAIRLDPKRVEDIARRYGVSV